MPSILFENEINFPRINANLFDKLEMELDESDNYIKNWSFVNFLFN